MITANPSLVEHAPSPPFALALHQSPVPFANPVVASVGVHTDEVPQLHMLGLGALASTLAQAASAKHVNSSLTAVPSQTKPVSPVHVAFSLPLWEHKQKGVMYWTFSDSMMLGRGLGELAVTPS